ncbi:MAG: SUMF1/EgtB/PvdO family nonheme iron enzyme [Gammaproteobacteria bacterium]|nr:SUMF1/EgtB/PvdO family nonheme iron enzyme [Gammaproteobacteria bacterium]
MTRSMWFVGSPASYILAFGVGSKHDRPHGPCRYPVYTKTALFGLDGFGVMAGKGAKRVNRGGSWNNNPTNVRAANRNRNTPGNRNNNLGFRFLSTRNKPDGRCLRISSLCTR